MSDSEKPEEQAEQPVEIILTLGAYIKELGAEQRRLPQAQRREVPTYEELAKETGALVHSIWQLTNIRYRKQLPLPLAYQVMRALRGRGFSMTIRDLITWHLPAALDGQAEQDRTWLTGITIRDSERLIVTVGPYLDHLRNMGQEIPRLAILAQEMGVSRRTLERWWSDQAQRLDLDSLSRLLAVLFRYGIPVRPENVLVYPGDVPQAK